MADFILSAFSDEIDENLEIQMEVLKQHAIKHIEMRGVNGRNLSQYTLDEVKEIKKQLDDKGFKISAIGSPIGKIMITDNFEPHLDLFKHVLEIAGILESKYIRMFSFYIPKNEDPAVYRNEVMERWKKFADTSKNHNVVLAHENEKDIYGDTAERCLDIIETMNCDYVKAVFDPANFVQCDVETYPHAFEILKNHIAYLHIKDAKADTKQVVPAGQGDGKIRNILDELNKCGYKGYLSLEPHLGSFKGLDGLELNPEIKDLPEGGPKQFAIAVQALKEIIDEVQAK